LAQEAGSHCLATFDTVLDCFGGSFSTAAACAITGRNFIGIERDKEAFEKGIDFVKNVPYDRWEKYVKSHISTGEKGGKFNFGVRSTMVKEIK
jgi:tRNA/tmRNA/rRNA uracil-C5-methylase (TrmA/RlmC/RlmD family)